MSWKQKSVEPRELVSASASIMSGLFHGLVFKKSVRSILAACVLAICFGAGLGLPGFSGPFVSTAEAHHWPSSCGREGQKPCPLIGPNRHVPSCMPDLVERPFGQRCSKKKPLISGGSNPLSPYSNPNCGAMGQRPCALPIVPSCEGDLVEHFIQGRCIQNEGDIVNMAKNTIREVGPLLSTIGRSVVDCGIDGIMLQANRNNGGETARRIQENTCWNSVLDNARRNGYRTVTIGSSGGVGLGIGGEGENGFAFDTARLLPVATYHTLGLKFGSIGAGGAVTIGLSKADNRSIGGDAHGATIAFSAIGGSGASAMFEYGNAEVASVSAVITAGAKFDISYVRNTTRVLSTSYPVVGNAGYTPPPPPGGSVDQPSRRRVPVGPTAAPPKKKTNTDHALDVLDSIQDAMHEATRIRLEEERRRIEEERIRDEENQIQTSVHLCNKTKHKRIIVSWAYRQDSFDGAGDRWRGRGGFEVKRGKCFLAGAYNYAPGVGYDDVMFIFASTPGRPGDPGYVEWQGTGLPFCVAHEGEFAHSESWKMHCDPAVGKVVRGHEYRAAPGVGRFEFQSDGVAR